MASTEARAKWLHYANRCPVEEDYKVVSDPGGQPPSSSKSQPEENPGDGVKSYDDTKWWLRQQPKDNATSIWETSWETLEMEALIGDTSQKKHMVGDVVGFQDDHLLISENPEKLLSESEPQLTGINKTEPWWRTTDLNELATFVSEKSLEHFDNPDLPLPQMNKPNQRFVHDKGLASLNHVSNFTDSKLTSPTSRFSPRGLDNPLSVATTDEAEDLVASSSELSKAQLLEALCHSQTRAREAEKALQQAYNEKEHMITHFLKQASQLFAYKQWLQILQLETTCLHLQDNKYQLIYTRFPDFVPYWVPTGKQQKKWVRCKAANKNSGSPRFEIGKSFGSFLLGLTLVGAGLLLGWTLGWLFR